MRTGRPDLDAMLRVASIPTEEPCFILRGQDACAVETVRFYAELVLARGGTAAMAEAALQQADAMSCWPTKKLPDVDLPEHQRRLLEYQHSRRGDVRSGDLPVACAHDQGRIAGAAQALRGAASVLRIEHEALAAGRRAYEAHVGRESDPGRIRLAAWDELPDEMQKRWGAVARAAWPQLTVDDPEVVRWRKIDTAPVPAPDGPPLRALVVVEVERGADVVGEAELRVGDDGPEWWWANEDGEYSDVIFPKLWWPLPAAPGAEQAAGRSGAAA